MYLKITTFFVGILILGTSQFAHAASTFTINEGWNLVSSDIMFELNSMQDNINGVESDLQNLINGGGALYMLNPKDQKYYGGSGSFELMEKNIESQTERVRQGEDNFSAMGIWLYTPKEILLSINFAIPRDFGDSRILRDEDYYQGAYDLFTGWNLVGVTDVMRNKSLTSLKGSCNFVSVYNFEKGAWRKQSVTDMGEKFTNDSLGHALAIKVVDDCSFNFKGGAPKSSLPALPE